MFTIRETGGIRTCIVSKALEMCFIGANSGELLRFWATWVLLTVMATFVVLPKLAKL